MAAKAILVILGVVACLFDWKYRRLPNWLSGLAALSGLVVAAANLGLSTAGSHLLHMIAALLIAFAVYAMRLIGGGDAKFYAGTAAWFALGDAMRLLLSVSLSGLALFAVWFAMRRIAKKPVRMKDASESDKLPYGVAIAVGGAALYLYL